MYQVNEDGSFVPIKFNSHRLSVTEARLSQYETELLALVFSLIKEEAFLAYNNATLHTDAKSLCFLAKFANSTAKLYRWNIFLHSYDITISFLPNSDAKIKFSDLLTRQGNNFKFRNKVSETQINDFTPINLYGMSDMKLSDAIYFITKLYNMISDDRPQNLQNIKNNFPDLPTRSGMVHDRLVCTPETCYVARVVDPVAPITASVKLPAGPIDLSSQTKISNKIIESLENFLPSTSKEKLSALQHTEEWLVKIIQELKSKRQYQSFTTHENIICKQVKINNMSLHLIVLPDQLAKIVLTNLHNVSLMHYGVDKMIQAVKTAFHIRRLRQTCENIIKNCKFCLLNKIYPNKPLNPGQKIFISKPRQFIYIDICSVDSSLSTGNFLTVVDGFSKYCMFLPVKLNPTAMEVCDMILHNVVRPYGFPVVISGDGAKYFSNSMLGTLASLLNCRYVKIVAYNSPANLAERFNKLALGALKVLHQSYTLTQSNFNVMLIIASNMINATKNIEGYSPYYLHMGTEPRLNNFITWMDIRHSGLKDHAAALVQAQNVAFAIANYNKIKAQKNNEIQQTTTFFKGQFVLVRKNKFSNTHVRHKIKPSYDSTIYRIVRRSRTNAVIVPYNKKFIESRFKTEGDIPKKICKLVRLQFLKPVKNIYSLLHLNITDQLMLHLNESLQKMDRPCQVVKIIKNPSNGKTKTNKIIKDFTSALQGSPSLHQYKIQCLQTYKSDLLESEDTFATIKIRHNKNEQKSLSTWSSTASPSFSMYESYFEDDDSYRSMDSDNSSDSSESSTNDSIISVVPLHTNVTSKSLVTKTVIDLPNNKRMTISYKTPESYMKDRQTIVLSRPEECETIQDLE